MTLERPISIDYSAWQMPMRVPSSKPHREPAIKKIDIIVPNKVVEVEFWDGKKYKSVCQEPDVFSLERAISICISKYLMGGSSAYNNAVRKGMKVYDKQLADEKAAKEKAERIAKKKEKRDAYFKRKAEKKKQEQIEIQKQAYIEAMLEINKQQSRYMYEQ